jgi:hypothetical protein
MDEGKNRPRQEGPQKEDGGELDPYKSQLPLAGEKYHNLGTSGEYAHWRVLSSRRICSVVV